MRRSRVDQSIDRDHGPPAPEAGAILTIDLDAVVANWRALARLAPPAACAAVVKADGYGCGIAAVTSALARAGCNTFFVANLAEGRDVRAVSPDSAVYVLNGLLPGTAPAHGDARLRPVLNSLAELARAGLVLLISHFVCAEMPGHPLNARQMAAFREIRTAFAGIAGSLANSSGIFLGPDAHHDLVRPGAALYGVNPTPAHVNPMRPVVHLRGRVLQTRAVPEGETVGYGAAWTARRASRIAIVAVGYADGFLRAASASDDKPGAEVLVAGRRCPLAGRISMDLLAIDVTDLPAEMPQRGELVTLIGEEIGVDEVAARAGTIGYEILTRLGRRCHRIYQET
jgi:alanine racemase